MPTPNETITGLGHSAIRRRSWLKFSLRTALLVVTVFCVWLANESSRARRQKSAITTVQRLGGRLAFDFQLDKNGQWKRPSQPRGPQWLRRAIGDDYFQRVAIVNFDEGSDPTNGDLAVLKDLPDLRQLTLMNRRRIADEGLRNLAGLRQLEVLALSGTQVKGAGLAHIRSLHRIKGLSLDGAPLADEGLVPIGALSYLSWLFLSNTKITDRGLAHLASLKSLEDLQIRGTNVTDEGLRHLEALSSLKRVLLGDTRVTESGRARLQQALPNCRVAD